MHIDTRKKHFNVFILVGDGECKGYCMNSYSADYKSDCMRFIEDARITFNAKRNPPGFSVIAEIVDGHRSEEIKVYEPFTQEAR